MFLLRKSFLIFSLCTFFLSISSQASKIHFIHMKLKNQQQRTLVANHIHIDQIIEDSAYAAVNDHDLKKLQKLFPKLIVETHVLQDLSVKTKSEEYEYPRGDEAFHTYQEVVDELKEYQRTYPLIAKLFDMGTSIEGRNIPGIQITGVNNQTKDSFIPGILFVGSHHAREHLSTEVPMYLIKTLLQQYGKDPRITQLINSRNLYFIPMLNVDGSLHDIKGRKYKYWRKNRVENSNGTFGVDLNRNYSFGWGTGGSSRSPNSDVYMGPKPFSEPETIAIKTFVQNHPNLRVLLSFHTFSELILYPWGGKKDGVGGKDQKVFEKMAKTMSKWNGYKPQQSADLYVASGDTCDWAYGEHGIFCFTFELSPKSRWSGGFYPGAKVIEKTSKVNLSPALYLIEKAADPYSAL